MDTIDRIHKRASTCVTRYPWITWRQEHFQFVEIQRHVEWGEWIKSILVWVYFLTYKDYGSIKLDSSGDPVLVHKIAKGKYGLCSP